MNRRCPMVAALAVLFASCLAACLDPFAPDVGGRRVYACDPEDTDPDHDVSFVVDILPLITRAKKEGGCSCHMADNPRAIGYQITGLDLTAYDTLVRGGAHSSTDIVVEGDPCISVIYLKTSETPPFGSQMPLGGPYWTAEERTLLHDWIAEGARGN